MFNCCIQSLSLICLHGLYCNVLYCVALLTSLKLCQQHINSVNITKILPYDYQMNWCFAVSCCVTFVHILQILYSGDICAIIKVKSWVIKMIINRPGNSYGFCLFQCLSCYIERRLVTAVPVIHFVSSLDQWSSN